MKSASSAVRGHLRAVLAHAVFSGRVAAEAVTHNKLRASLTALGILFGVASVIAMLAIGNGAEQEILAQMRLLGANTIVITPVSRGGADQSEAKDDARSGSDKLDVRPFTPGLTMADAAAIRHEIPDVDATSSEVVYASAITREGRHRPGQLVGVDSTYFRVLHLPLAEGSEFSARHFATAAPVAIIGQGVQARFFTTADPIGQRIKVGKVWLTVVGMLHGQNAVSTATAKRLGVRDANLDVYVPLPTMLLRYRNRGEVTRQEVQAEALKAHDTGDSSDAARAERRNYNQLDEVIVQVDKAPLVGAVADVVRRILDRRHDHVADFDVTVPELLLKQEQDTRRLFNIVLGAIASISLLVGGIGIMNIMLASILERIKEIGVRRALGATQSDVLWQFLTEAVMISLTGGVVGVLLGAGFSAAIARFAHIHTLVSATSIVIAFGVSVAVGVAFGIVPASRAARQDPITCLRYE